ncbi:MAG: zinc ribbon domain-containing protein [Candidatus Heimdallarchaeota archaeon]|nr:zinc ribbon domain-containing protein [Candidatus Heimdallarchaeota archaeon]
MTHNTKRFGSSRKQHFKSMRQKREMERVKQLLSLSKQQNGKVNTVDIAEIWQIPVSKVLVEVEYLIRKYSVPITRVVKNYPTFVFDQSAKYASIHQESAALIKDTKFMEDQLPTPKSGISGVPTITFCGNCGTRVEGTKFCPTCGTEISEFLN